MLQPVRSQKGNKTFILGRDRGPSDCGAQKVPGLCSHAMPLGGRTHHLSVSAAAKRQQLASTCWYLLLAISQAMWLQSTRRTATLMPAPAAGAANGLAVLSRASRPQPRPTMHWTRPCALIRSI